MAYNEELKVFTLKDAVSVCAMAHAGQIDKQGNIYIFHPLAVMEMCNSEEAKIVAALHDVVEDTVWTLEDLRKVGCPEKILEAIDAITKRKGESLGNYCVRVRRNPLAKEVKIKDVAHNLSRLDGLPFEVQERLLNKYSKTLFMLVNLI